MSSSLYMALGYICNHNCFFCPCGRKKGSVFAEKISIDDAIEHAIGVLGIRHITLSGGEPTLHKDFSKILKKCILLGADVTVLTNGDLLHDIDFARFCFGDVDPQHVSVVSAIHASSAVWHDKVTGVSGSFERTIKGLNNLQSLHIPVEVKQCVSAWNYKGLPGFPGFLVKQFGSSVSATIVGMDYCGMEKDEIDQVAIGYSDMAPYIERMLDSVEDLRHRFRAFPRFSVCDLPLCPVDPYYWRYYVKSSRRELAQYSAPSAISTEMKSSFNVSSQCDIFFEACLDCQVKDLCPGSWRTACEYFGEHEVHAIH